MRVSRMQAEHNRETVLDTAGQLFRENGFDGIGIVDIMKAAGLTHGGFYGQFASKEQLAAEASSKALAKSRDRLAAAIAAAPHDPMAAIAGIYLTQAHRDAPGQGCAFAALAADAARSGQAVHAAFGAALEGHLALLTHSGDGDAPAGKISRQTALAAFSMMVGALVLSRAVEDPVLSSEVLEAAILGLKHMS